MRIRLQTIGKIVFAEPVEGNYLHEVQTLEECETKCNNKEDCSWYTTTWYSACVDEIENCQLFKSRGQFVEQPGFTSGHRTVVHESQELVKLPQHRFNDGTKGDTFSEGNRQAGKLQQGFVCQHFLPHTLAIGHCISHFS